MKIKPDAPAFPTYPDEFGQSDGLTVRAEFAKCFMAAMLPTWRTLGLSGDYSPMAAQAVAQADALIVELNKGSK